MQLNRENVIRITVKVQKFNYIKPCNLQLNN